MWDLNTWLEDYTVVWHSSVKWCRLPQLVKLQEVMPVLTITMMSPWCSWVVFCVGRILSLTLQSGWLQIAALWKQSVVIQWHNCVTPNFENTTEGKCCCCHPESTLRQQHLWPVILAFWILRDEMISRLSLEERVVDSTRGQCQCSFVHI